MLTNYSFNYLGMNQTLNLIISSALFGIFITWYYKGSGLCIALLAFYWAMFVISQSLEVIWMLSISVIVYLVMTQIVLNSNTSISVSHLIARTGLLPDSPFNF